MEKDVACQHRWRVRGSDAIGMAYCIDCGKREWLCDVFNDLLCYVEALTSKLERKLRG